MNNLDNKVADITGAARGQGDSAAELFVAAAAQVWWRSIRQVYFLEWAPSRQ